MDENNPPFSFVDAEGAPAGLLIDLWRLWSQKSGRSIAFLPATGEESMNAVVSGKADVHAGLHREVPLSRRLLFSEALSGRGAGLYHGPETPPLDDLVELDAKQVGVLGDSWLQEHLLRLLPSSAITPYENLMEMLAALRRGEISYILADHLAMESLLDRQRLRGTIQGGDLPLATNPLFAGVGRQEEKLLQEINSGMKQISGKERLAIERRWIRDEPFRYFAAQRQVAPLQLSAEQQSWLADHRSISIGLLADWAPIDFTDSHGRQQGITADYLRLIEERLHISFQGESRWPWAETLERAKKGQLDLVADMVRTKERSISFDFTSPYFQCPYILVARRGDGRPVESMADLDGKTVAVERGYYLEPRLQDEYPHIRLLRVDTTLAALEAVSHEKADAYIGNRAVASWLIEHKQMRDLKIAGRSDFAPTSLRFAVRRDWPQLVSLLNLALESITAEEHRAIYKKWLGADDADGMARVPVIAINPEEQRWLDGLGSVRLGVDPNWMPLEFLDERRRYSGFSSDYMRRFLHQLGLRRAPVEKMSWPTVLRKIEEKELDMAPMIVVTAERSRFMNFSKPYLNLPIVIFTRADSDLITGLDDIAGKRLAVEQGYMTAEYLKNDYPDMVLHEVPTTLDALRAVAYGQVDAFVGNLLTGSYLIDREGLFNVKIAAPTPYRSELRIGVRKDWPQLIPLLNRAIDTLSEGDRAAISRNWLRVRYEQQVNYALVWKILGASAVVVMLVLYRNWELNRRKEELRASEERYHLAMDAVSEAIWEWDLLSNACHFSPGFFISIGYEYNEVPRSELQWQELLHPDDRRRFRKLLPRDAAQAAHQDSALLGNFRIRAKSGLYVHVHFLGKVVKRDSAGAPLLCRGTLRDISREKEAEEQFKALINTLPIAILVVDESGAIIFDNPQAGREFGGDTTLIGRKSLEFYADSRERERILEIVAERGEVLGRHVRFTDAGGKIIDCLLSVLPVRFDERNALLGVMVNVTDRMKMEQALVLAKKKAEEADRMKSAFLASMSHELRTPLNSIIGFTGILLQQLAGPLNDEQNKQLTMVQSSSRHLLALINDVLDISKIEAGELKMFPESFDLRLCLEKVITSLQPQARLKGLDLLLEIAEEVGELNSDQRRVEQIVLNLVANGIKFTDRGWVKLSCRVEGQTVLVAVRDSGPGIKEADMEKLFHSFQQIDTGLSRVHEGTGLGLSISKKLVEMLGGDIRAESTWGAGSTFTFRLPLAYHGLEEPAARPGGEVKA